ncbi:unnamed protein product [Closterium sp. NIES-53]
MASQCLVSGLPHVFATLSPSPAPTCTPCIVGRLHATPHSSSLRPAIAPLQNLNFDVWGPAPTQRPERERYFLVVVDDYSRYTMVFPLAKKSEETSTLIWWLLATEGTHGRRVSCLHSDRGGEFRSGILRGFCGEQGISQSWTLPESPQHNGVAERRIGLVMDIARTSMIHARAPHFLWPYASLDRVPFRVLACLALVRDTSVDKLSARAIPCVFLGFPVDSPDYAFYHPPLHHFLDSVTSGLTSQCPTTPGTPVEVSRSPLLLLLSSSSSPPPAPAPPVPPPPVVLPRQVPVDSGGVGAGGADTGGARSGGAPSRDAGAGGAGAGGAGTGGASSGGARAGGAGTGGASSGGARASGTDTGGATSGDTGTVGASSEETGVRDTTSAVPAQPPHCHDTRLQAARRRAREEQEYGLRALGLPSSSPVRSPSLPAFGPSFPPPGVSPAVWSSPRSPSSPPIVPHYRVRPYPPRARPSSPVTDLHTALFCSSRRRSPPESVLLSPPPSSLPDSPTPISDYYRAACPVVSRVLATLATDSRFSPSSVSALTVKASS